MTPSSTLDVTANIPSLRDDLLAQGMSIRDASLRVLRASCALFDRLRDNEDTQSVQQVAKLVECGLGMLKSCDGFVTAVQTLTGANGAPGDRAPVRAAGAAPARDLRDQDADAESKPVTADQLGLRADALMKAGEYDKAILTFTQAIARAENVGVLAKAESKLGAAFLHVGKHREAGRMMRRSFIRGRGLPIDRRRTFVPAPRVGLATPSSASSFALNNSADQIDYLIARGRIDGSFSELAARYREVSREIAADHSRPSPAPLDDGLRERLGGYLEKVLYFDDCPAIDGSALNEAIDVDTLQREYFQRGEVVVCDDILGPEALGRLRQFLLESTIFIGNSPDLLATYMQTGLSCDLAFQLVDEVARKLERIIHGQRLANLWCFKHGHKGAGVKPHADEASVTVSLWLTPDEANQDPESGGLIIYDKLHPKDWDFHSLNTYRNESWVQERIAEELRGVEATRIPYKYNRAVIFRSARFHQTEPFTFVDDYVSRRMNVTMVFGDFDLETHEHP
jgi:tetratricopeptide (TPR) repeat protein